MKAHIVKGIVFAIVFLLAAQSSDAVAATAGWANDFSVLLCCGFCPSSWVGSTYGFVMNHVFAVAAGMSLC